MSVIFQNGAFFNDKDAFISATDRGFTLADGVFDTMLAADGVPVHGDAHYERLCRHAAVMKIDFDLDFIGTAQTLLEKNDYSRGRYVIRTTITRGPGARGLAPPDSPEPTIVMRAGSAPDPETLPPVKAVIAGNVRRNEHSPLSQIKSLNYGDNLLALMEARDKGGSEAIMLNTAGHVACATIANIFIREGGHYITPPMSDGVLDGITRQRILEREAVTEDSITKDRLMAADAVYLTNSVMGVRAVAQLNDRAFTPDPADPFLHPDR